MKSFVLLLLAFGLSAAGPLWLCRVDGVSAREAAAAGIPVVMELSDCCLAWLEPEAFAGNPRVRALEPDQPGRCWLYVMPDPKLDRSLLGQFGTVLTEDAEGVVLSTTGDGILSLNSLQVELAGIGKEPMVFTEPAVPEPAALPDSLIWQLVGRVSLDTITSELVRLRQFRTRYATTDSCRRAIDWVRQKLAAYGCDSTWLETFSSGYAPNVIGRKLGTVNPQRIYVVCAHVDNTSPAEFRDTLAPGSDDNGSGTVAVLEACRVYADMEFDNTVLFVGFSAEEQGLIGSDSFARRAQRRGDSIMLAVNFDMISYGRQNMDTIRIVHHPSSGPGSQMADFFIAQADTFTDLKTKKYPNDARLSDHASFWQYGYNAIRGGYNDRTPMYHTLGDTIGPLYYTNCGTNNIPMHTEVVKALVAVVAKLGGAHPMTGVEEGRSTPYAPRLTPGTRITGGLLFLPPAPLSTRCSLFDSDGRKVANLRSGQNDVSWLTPGVYFVSARRSAVSGERSALLKVILAR